MSQRERGGRRVGASTYVTDTDGHSWWEGGGNQHMYVPLRSIGMILIRDEVNCDSNFCEMELKLNAICKGPYIKDVRKIFRILDALPPLSAFLLNL